jgi:hypothetical protein
MKNRPNTGTGDTTTNLSDGGRFPLPHQPSLSIPSITPLRGLKTDV